MKKIFLFFVILGALLATAGWLITSVYEKQVIASFQQEINKYLNTKIDADIDGLTIWENFPNVSIVMRNVKVHGSLPSHHEKLAELEEVHFTINLMDLLRKEYKIETAELSEGFVNLYVDASGTPNYLFLKENKSQTSGAVQFDFNNVHLSNVQVNYENEQIAQNYRIYVHELSGQLSLSDNLTTIETRGDFDVEYLQIEDTRYITGKKLTLKATVQVNTESKEVLLGSTDISVQGSSFTGEGNIDYGKNIYSIQLKSKQADFASIVALMPENIYNTLKKYDANGSTSFSLSLRKGNESQRMPRIYVSFGCKEVTLFEPETKRKFTNLNFRGSFDNGIHHALRSSELVLENISGKLDGVPLQSKLRYFNFENPTLTCFLKGTFPLDFLMSFSDTTLVTQPSGKVGIDIKIDGLLSDFKKNNTDKINSSGQLELHNVGFVSPTSFYAFKNLKGSLLFNQHDVAISGFQGTVNNSDFKVDGFLKGFFGFTFSKNQKMIVNATLSSKLLDFDQLVETSDADTAQPTPLRNEFLKDIQFNLKANVKKVKWGPFHIQNAGGTVMHNDRVFLTPKITGEIGGGGFFISGKLDTRKADHVALTANTSVDGIHIDSIFHYFNDFKQDFITKANLKGRVYLQSTNTMVFDQYLNVKPETIVSNITAKVTNGQLNDFEPMQNLSTFIDASELRNISFSELENTITIKDQKIEFPEMIIRSSASVLTIRGWHTFDQEFYYKLKIPLKNLSKVKRQEASEATSEGVDGPIVHLIMSGNIDDWTIKYDKQATMKVIEHKVKEEVRQVRDIIDGTYQEEEEEQIGLEEDFFEFENDSIDE